VYIVKRAVPRAGGADRTITPEQFARILAADVGILSDQFQVEVARSINEQLQALRTVGAIPTTSEHRLRIKVRSGPRAGEDGRRPLD